MRVNESFLSLTNFWQYVIINTVIALGITLFFCTSCFFNPEQWSEAVSLWSYSFFISLALSGGISKVDERFDHLIPWNKSPLKRFLIELFMITIYSFVACFIVIFLFHWIMGHFTLDNIPFAQIIEQTQSPIIIAYIITGFFVSRSFLMQWKEAAVDAEKLRSERYANQYQVLKDQLNPHFLFNSLNVLSNVVHEDQDKAVDFIQQLSRFYRYVLDVQHEEVVSLEKELDFAKRYLYLQKLRFEDKLKVEVEAIAEEQDHIPPLALQLCLENAIKHNEVSQDNPLYIRISREADKLCITNTIQPKTDDLPEPSGIGLRNIKERYRLLSDQTVDVQKTDKEFRVYLPVVKHSNKL